MMDGHISMSDMLSDKVIVEGNSNNETVRNDPNSDDIDEFFNQQRKDEKTRRRKLGTGRDADVRLMSEDMEEEEINVNIDIDGRLLDDDLISFISVYFSDDIFYNSNFHSYKPAPTYPETDKKGFNIYIYKQNVIHIYI